MPQAWGTATANKSGGGSDPNVLKLGDQSRIRLLDAEGPRKWRQHGIDGKVLHKLFPNVDEAHFSSAVCPRGADGTGSAVCPCDMKPSWVDDEGKVHQLFPVSIRYAANVWDYETNSVKVLIAGKQVFAEFDAVAQVGFDPTATDFVIFKMGKSQQTSYKVVRGGSDPLPKEIKPEDLHNLDKYEAADSADRIFERLAAAGVDYDAIPLPQFEIEAALQFVMPYTKHKGLTMEQLFAVDADFMKWLYGTKREQGQYGDAVFQAMHTVLLDAGETTPLEDLPKAPPRAAVKPPPQAPAQTVAAPLVAAPVAPASLPPVPGHTYLIPPTGGDPQPFPEVAVQGLLAAGFTEIPPEPAPAPETPAVLVGPSGDEIDVSAMPSAAIAAMLASGYQPKGAPAVAEPAAEPADTDEVTVDVGGTQATMLYSVAKALIAAGSATLVTGGAPAAAPEPEPVPPLPGDDEQVQVQITGVPTPVPMAFKDALPLVHAGTAAFADASLAALVQLHDKADDKAIARQAAADAEVMDPPQAAAQAGNALDKALTAQNEAGRWAHPALPGKDFATKGAVTQALNRLEKDGGSSSPTPPTPAAPAAGTAPAAPAAPVPPTEGRDAKLEVAKKLMAVSSKGYMDDFTKLVGLFEEVAGKRNISDFTEPEIDQLIERLQKEQAAG